LDIPYPIQQDQYNNKQREFFVAEKFDELKISVQQGGFSIPIIIQDPERENKHPYDYQYPNGVD
jgi:hypothetical protein